METKPEVNVGKYVGRRLSQLKLMTRLLEHEIDSAKGNREITLDRGMLENILDAVEIFVDDCESATGGGSRDRQKVESKPAVARLN